MTYEFSVYALIMGTISILALFLLLYPLFQRQKSRVTLHFIFLVAAAACWCIGYTLEFAATDQFTMMFWNYIQYLGIFTLPPILFLFILTFTQRTDVRKKPILSLLFFPPFVHYLFLLTNDFHSLFYEKVGIQSSPFGSSLELVYGPLFYSNTIYSYLLLALGYYILIRTYLYTETNTLYQKQLLILIIGTSTPILGNIIRVSGVIPLEVDLTPGLFIIAYTLFTYALFEFGFLDIVPIARKRVFEEIYDGFIVLDTEGIVIDLNKSAHNILLPQLKISELYGKNIYSLLKKEIQQKTYHAKINEVQAGLNEIKLGKSSIFSAEFEVLTPLQDVPMKSYDLLASPLKSPKGEAILGFVVILRDITDRVTAERTLRQKNQMQDLILKLLSHDLYNHLNVLQAYTEIAREASNLEGTKEGLLAIQVKSEATMRLINEVTSYLKVEDVLRSSSFERYDLIGGIKASIKQLQPELDTKHIITEIILPEEPVYILANLAMNSVIFNIISNAIRYSPSKGIIKIKLKAKNDYWSLSVADQGVGIPEELKSKIFEPFSAFGKKRGTGLGLTIAYEAIQFFLGRVWIEDVQPHGTVFQIEIPKITES